MSIKKYFSRDKFWLVISILAGFIVGVIILLICHQYKLTIFGIYIDIFIAPLVAGFIETYISNYTRKKSSGAISAIVMFVLTNFAGWFHPTTPIKLNIFTIGGIFLMIQAAFPLMMNYIIIAFVFLFSYLFGVMGGYVGKMLNKNNFTTSFKDMEDLDNYGVRIFNSKPDIPIKEYHGLVFSEDVIEFEDKNREERIKYLGSDKEDRESLKLQDYALARRYILNNLEKEAAKINANAIIDMEFEYTNYNQQLPPDVLIAAYGTAVTIDEKYL